MSQGESTQPRKRRRLLGRGESVLIPIGIALAGIMATGIGASAWWSLRTQHAMLAQARAQQTTAAGEVVTRAAESMLAAGELSDVRNLILEAGRVHGFSQCQIVLPDNAVLADIHPAQITQATLPEQWPASAATPDRRQPMPGSSYPDDDWLDDQSWGDDHAPRYIQRGNTLTNHNPMTIPGRGTATLIIQHDDAPHFEDAQWQTQAGTGAIGVAAMASLLLVYRRMKQRVAAMTLISEAMVALENEQQDEASLKLDDAFGPHARAFNKVLRDRQALREQLLLRQAEQSLGSNERRSGELATLCDALRQGLMLVDQNQQVRYANGAAAVYLNVKRDQVVGTDVAKLVNDPDLLEAINSCIAGPSRQRKVVELDRNDDRGGGLLRFNIKPIHRDDKPACIIVVEDVTQQRVAEDARNTFVAHATHELRMPLTNIRLYLETALEDGENDPKLRGECLNVINNETKRLERLVGDMLSITEIESGSLKIEKDDVRLDAMFEVLEADYVASAKEKHITLTFNLPPKFPVIQGDRDKIVMALHNLLGNAIKYTPEQGKVDVNVETEPGKLTIEVKDTGFGISEQDAPKIFEKFYRARDSRVNEITGSGLGLALAREVIRLHGGDIVLQSELNKGSVFTLTLPTPNDQ